MKDKIIIIGGGGHSKIIIDILNKTRKYKIEAIIVDDNTTYDNMAGYKVYNGNQYIDYFLSKGIKMAVLGVGAFKDNIRRKMLFEYLENKGFELINVIDSTAVISKTVKIGKGNTIFPGVVINTDVIIEDNVIIATGTTIDHETQINNHVLISAGVTIGGYCKIKEGALIALGANIVSGIEIGAYSLVAAGATVVSNIEDFTKVYGTPAKTKA